MPSGIKKGVLFYLDPASKLNRILVESAYVRPTIFPWSPKSKTLLGKSPGSSYTLYVKNYCLIFQQ